MRWILSYGGDVVEELLKVENLKISFHTYAGVLRAVRGVSFTLKEGETLAMVGESGCGKTVTAKAIMRLTERSGGVMDKDSAVYYKGMDITRMNRKELNHIRGKELSMIFQDSMTSLNPTMTIGKQIVENIRTHEKCSSREAFARAEDLLRMVEIPDAGKRLRQYPHQLSGGMRQRAMIAIALACSPKILIADEPTTALDVTIQGQLLDLLRDLKEKLNMSMILVTHDLGVVAECADRIQVMYAGKVLERGSVEDIFNTPAHPYTWALLKSVPGSTMGNKTELYSLQGTPPDLMLPLNNCPFAARCEYCMPICRKSAPAETRVEGGAEHSVSCWLRHKYAPEVRFEKEGG